jgi:hypothetical protein
VSLADGVHANGRQLTAKEVTRHDQDIATIYAKAPRPARVPRRLRVGWNGRACTTTESLTAHRPDVTRTAWGFRARADESAR